MIPFQKIKPFIAELAVLILVISGILFGLLKGNFIEITFHAHFITIFFFLMILVLFLFLFSRVINLGVRSLMDYIFQNVKVDQYTFIKEIPYKASVFSEKYNSCSERTLGMYFLIQAKKDNAIVTFISPDYLELSEGKTYKIQSAACSHIVLNCEEQSGK